MPPNLAHFLAVAITTPLPLHALVPLQALDAVLQALLPLQALTP